MSLQCDGPYVTFSYIYSFTKNNQVVAYLIQETSFTKMSRLVHHIFQVWNFIHENVTSGLSYFSHMKLHSRKYVTPSPSFFSYMKLHSWKMPLWSITFSYMNLHSWKCHLWSIFVQETSYVLQQANLAWTG